MFYKSVILLLICDNRYIQSDTIKSGTKKSDYFSANTYTSHERRSGNMAFDDDAMEYSEPFEHYPMQTRVLDANNDFQSLGRRYKRGILRNLRDKLKNLSKFRRYRWSSYTSYQPLEWVNPPAYRRLPQDAFLAGIDMWGYKIYIGRVFEGNEEELRSKSRLVPGRLAENKGCVDMVMDSGWFWGRCSLEYKVLVGKNYRWQKHRGKNFPENVVTGGFIRRTLLFICRYFINEENITDHLMVGFVSEHTSYCYVNFDGAARVYINLYEILVYNDKNKK